MQRSFKRTPTFEIVVVVSEFEELKTLTLVFGKWPMSGTIRFQCSTKLGQSQYYEIDEIGIARFKSSSKKKSSLWLSSLPSKNIGTMLDFPHISCNKDQ